MSQRIAPKDIYCADINPPPISSIRNHLTLNALDREGIEIAIKKYHIRQVYCLAALLSATGEVNPLKTEEINMQALFNTLEVAK